MKKNYLLFEKKISLKLAIFIALFGFLTSSAQVTTNGGSGLAPTYPDLVTAITALNAATITSPVVITLAGNETAPLGGFSITAQGSVTNTITIEGVASTITAPTPQASGILTDAVFKLVGADWVTIQGFTMLENALNTTVAAGTNNMTEWGVALLYATTTNGAQNNTIRNNTIDLDRTYQNTSGIYSNSTHTATNITTAASATTTTGGNSGLKIYSNTITDVNLGIVVIGPTAIADQNVGIDIGGTSLTTANTISNFGTTGTFSGFANVSGTVNGILIRNSNGTNISFNTITSSVGGVASGTLNGIQVAASSTVPTGLTFTNTINNNTISLRSGTNSPMNGITYPSGSASATSTLNINNNNFNTFGHTIAATSAIIFITTASTNQFTTINNNTFTNISVNTSGSVTFISQSFTAPATGSKEVNNNAIVTGFTKSVAGGTVIFVADNGSTASGAVSNCINNNFSNITLAGATAVTGINYTDGGTAPTRTVTGNILNNITTGAAAMNLMNFTYWNGVSSLSNNTITNINGQGAITAITLGNAVNTATSVSVNLNTINNLVSSGTGGAVTGISCINTSPSISIINNSINTLSSTAATIVGGIIVSASNATTGTNISQNTIYNLTNSNAAGIATVTGIQIAGTGVGNVIQRNLIYDLNLASTNASAEANGIKITGGTNTLRNNMIRFGAGIPNAVLVSGINESVGTNSIFHNSVYVSGSPTTGTGNSFAFNGSVTVNVRSFRNNIFFNARSNSGATGKNYAVKVGGTGVNPTGLTINNNVYFANGVGSFVGLYAGTDAADLLAWQTAVGQDANSIVADPLYVSTTDLSLQSGSPAIDIAANLSVINDFTGDARPGLNSLFDIGADERDGIALVPNDIQATAFINPVNGANRGQNVAFVPQASFTNNGTANQTNITVRYRIVDPSSVEVYNQTFVIPSLASFATTTVTFPNATLTSLGAHTIFAKSELGSDTVLGNDQITGTLNVLTPLAGTYTVGTAGDYASLTNAGGIFDILNNIGASSNITINIISDLTGETGAVALNEIAGGFTTLIQPTGAARTITGSSTGGLIRLIGADGVTINGALGSGSTRDLTIINTNVGTSSVVIWNGSANASNGANNNTIKNTIVSGNAPLTTFTGIFSGSGTTVGAVAEATNNNFIVENNNVIKSQYGIAIVGATAGNTGNRVSLNNIGSTVPADYIGFIGLFVSNNNGILVDKNTISNIITTASNPTGINISGNVINSTFDANSISEIAYTGTSGYGGKGMNINTGNATSNLTISNNMISGIRGDGWNSFLSDSTVGVRIGANGGSTVTTGGIKLYNNTVNLGSGVFVGNSSGTLSAALYLSSATSNLDIRNNIFVTNLQNSNASSAKTWAINSAALNTAFTTINNNNYAVSGTQGVLGFISSDRATLANIQTGFGQNTASVSIPPVFVSATNLHLIPASNPTLDNLGTPIAGVTVDIDGDSRSATTPDLGADEFVSIADCSFTTTWSGSSWNNGAPVAGVKALITGNYSGPAITACTLDVNSPANVVFTTGNATIEGVVTVQSGATLTLNNNVNLLQTTNVANSGNITVIRTTNPLMRFDYVMWSSPVDGTQTLTGFSPLTSVSPTVRFYNYDSATNLYTSILAAATTEFTNATGYLIRLPFDHPTAPTTWTGSFVGQPNNGPISLGSLTNGLYYATGNPYPSTINADAFITANNLNDALYFWRKTNAAAGSAYATYTLAGGTLPSPGTLASPTSGIPNGTIQVGQGFIAKANSTSFVFDNSMRVANNANQSFKSSSITATTNTIERNRVWLNLADATETIGQTMISYMTGATNGLDAQIDGQYFNDSATALTSLIGSQEYAIQGRVLPFTASDVVPLGFKTEIAGNYSISIFDKDGLFLDNSQIIYLRDNLTNNIHNLNSGAYNFASQAGVFNTRFDVIYQNALSTDDIDFTSNNVTIYNQNNVLNINSGSNTMSTVKVYDVLGRLLAQSNKVNASQTQINVPATNQTLIVQITSSEGIVVVKKVAN